MRVAKINLKQNLVVPTSGKKMRHRNGKISRCDGMSLGLM